MFGTDYDYATGYEEFRIELFGGKSKSDPSQPSFKLRASSESGEAMDFDYYPPVTSYEIEEAFAGVVRANAQFALSVPRSTSDEIRALGERLYNSVMQSRIRDLYLQSFNRTRENGKNLRLRFVINDPALADLPWEFLFDPSKQDFLTLSTLTPVARKWSWPTAPTAHSAFIDPPLRMTVVEAEVRPWDTGAEMEIASLERLAKEFPQLLKIVNVVRNATAESLFEALGNDSYDVLHLCLSGATDAVLRQGGTGSGGMARTSNYGPSSHAESLLVEDKTPGLNRSAESVSLQSLRIAILSSKLQLITLSGDCTDWLASQLTEECPATLGWRGLNTPEAYQSFSEGFYSSLIRGLPLEAAVTHGRKAIDEKYPGGKEWGMLVFYMQTKDGVVVRQPTRAADTTQRYTSEYGVAPSNPKNQREWTKLGVLLSVAEENYRVLLNEVGKYGKNAVPDYINSQKKLLEEQISGLISDLQQLGK